MSKLKTFTYQDICSWRPCYNPILVIPKSWAGTVLDILYMKHIPPEDRLWCALHKGLLSDRTLRVFGTLLVKEGSALLSLKPSQLMRALIPSWPKYRPGTTYDLFCTIRNEIIERCILKEIDEFGVLVRFPEEGELLDEYCIITLIKLINDEERNEIL